MKNKFLSLLLLGVLLLTAGCHEAIYEKLDELEGRTEAIQLYCDQLNATLVNLQNLVQAVQQQDMITGITEIRSGNTVTGYRINFVKHDPITIYNGLDGKKPLVASRRNPDDGNYYWSVQYGDEDWQWMKSPDGQMMLSIGVLPYVTIRDGYFVYTLDGKTWTQLAKADGVSGDQMFQSIDTSHKEYVLITLSTGEVLMIPTYSTYLALKAELDKTNDNVDAQVELVTATKDKLTWITRIDPLKDGADTVGLTVALSNGKSFTLHDWISSLSPAIFIKRAADNHLYWAYTIGDSPDQWVLSPDGKKISAESESVDTPLVSVTLDSLGHYYWTVITKDSTELLRTKVGDAWVPEAVDSVNSIFSSVTDYTDSLVVVLKDKTRFVLPKLYTVSIFAPDGSLVTDHLSMKEKDVVVLRYTASGPKPALSLVPQGGFTATDGTLDTGETFISIKSPASFSSGTGKVMAFFTFPSSPSPVTVIKTITINKEG